MIIRIRGEQQLSSLYANTLSGVKGPSAGKSSTSTEGEGRKGQWGAPRNSWKDGRAIKKYLGRSVGRSAITSSDLITTPSP